MCQNRIKFSSPPPSITKSVTLCPIKYRPVYRLLVQCLRGFYLAIGEDTGNRRLRGGNKGPRQLVGRRDVSDTCRSSCVTPWRHRRAGKSENEEEYVPMKKKYWREVQAGDFSAIVDVCRCVWPVDFSGRCCCELFIWFRFYYVLVRNGSFPEAGGKTSSPIFNFDVSWIGMRLYHALWFFSKRP